MGSCHLPLYSELKHGSISKLRRTFEMPVVGGQADAVQAETLEEGGIGVGEEVLQEL